MLINKRESVGSTHCNDPKAFIKFCNNIDNICAYTDEYNLNKNAKYCSYLMIRLLIWLVTKKLQPIVTELFTRGRKLNIPLIFIAQYYFAVMINIILRSTHYFNTKIPNKKELQEIAIQAWINCVPKTSGALSISWARTCCLVTREKTIRSVDF